jgi:hypothetical protein
MMDSSALTTSPPVGNKDVVIFANTTQQPSHLVQAHLVLVVVDILLV